SAHRTTAGVIVPRRAWPSPWTPPRATPGFAASCALARNDPVVPVEWSLVYRLRRTMRGVAHGHRGGNARARASRLPDQRDPCQGGGSPRAEPLAHAETGGQRADLVRGTPGRARLGPHGATAPRGARPGLGRGLRPPTKSKTLARPLYRRRDAMRSTRR